MKKLIFITIIILGVLGITVYLLKQKAFPALAEIQVVDSYSEDNYNEIGNMSATFFEFAQSFTSLNNCTLDSVKFYFYKDATLTQGNLYARIYDETHATTFGLDSLPVIPALATSTAIAASTIPTSISLITFNFEGENRITLNASTNYVISLYFDGSLSLPYFRVGRDTTSPTHSGNMSFNQNINYTWATSEIDLIFYVYGETEGGGPAYSTESAGVIMFE